MQINLKLISIKNIISHLLNVMNNMKRDSSSASSLLKLHYDCFSSVIALIVVILFALNTGQEAKIMEFVLKNINKSVLVLVLLYIQCTRGELKKANNYVIIILIVH